MGKYSQEGRPFELATPLGKDVLLLEGFNGREAISRPYSFNLDVASDKNDGPIVADDLLRKPVAIEIRPDSGDNRSIHGIVNRFVQYGQDETFTHYQMEIVPWFWFLSLGRDCRIFQQKNVLEIVEDVFKDAGYNDFDIKCTKSYQTREYCVQYRESNLDFVSRLLEEEGIFFFFVHTSSNHTLTLVDSNLSTATVSGQSTAGMRSQAKQWQGEGVITSLVREHNVHTGKSTLKDYDFSKPSVRLQAEAAGGSPEEHYDYPGHYKEQALGDQYALVRLEEQEMMHDVVRGQGNVCSLESGYCFDLKDHYDSNTNTTYLLTSVSHTARGSSYLATDGADYDYRNTFVAIPNDIPFRPARITRRPVIQGTQTAVVVGKAGEEIFVDKYGRVKIQFHWDRDGKKDENSSCWVRVASVWAGNKWGFIQIPRIGQEVIVEFMEGDPSQPVITGRLWNANQMPPYDLPDKQNISGMKSNSTKGGSAASNYNEFRFDDTKGKEEILLHAEKNLETGVENDETRTVGNTRKTEIGTPECAEGNDELTLKKGDHLVTLDMGNQETVLKMGDQKTTTNIGNITISADLGKITLEAMQAIELKCGPSNIKIDPMGVTIKGMKVAVEGQVQVEVKGLMTQVNGDAMLKMRGGVTMIN